MGRMSDWMIGMEEDMAEAIETGANSPSLVMSFCRGRGIIDEKFIQRRLLEMFGPGGDFDVEQEPEL